MLRYRVCSSRGAILRVALAILFLGYANEFLSRLDTNPPKWVILCAGLAVMIAADGTASSYP